MSFTAPVKKDNFAFANGDLFADASGNSHRRASPAELKTHFDSGTDKDRPAHWFEAQLVHYGLKASKTKAVARMRLFDAVKAGDLAVPAHIVKLEAELKKGWNKNEREAKQSAKGASGGKQTAEKKTGVKRKAEDNVNFTLNVGGINISVQANSSSSSSQNVAKKVKTSKVPAPGSISKAGKIPASKQKEKKPAMPATKPKPQQLDNKVAGPSSTKGKSSASKAKAAPTSSKASAKGASAKASKLMSATPVKKHPAKKSIPFSSRPSISHDEPPPPYSESLDNSRASPNSGYPPLGFLNGRYEVHTGFGSDSGLILTLHGNKLWGSFDLSSSLSGILFFEERPWVASGRHHPFIWRGRDEDGEVHYGHRNEGWMVFEGDGRVRGDFDWQDSDATFWGERVSGQATKSEISAKEMERQWEELEAQGRAREEYFDEVY